MIHYDRVWAEIDLDAIIKNMESIKSRIDKNAQVVAVIKTDENYKQEYLLFVLIAIISLFMTTKFFPWGIMPSVL